jgi:hypothetical protein
MFKLDNALFKLLTAIVFLVVLLCSLEIIAAQEEIDKNSIIVVNSVVGDIALNDPISYPTNQSKYKINSKLYKNQNFQLNINKTILEKYLDIEYTNLNIIWTSNLRQMFISEDKSEVIYYLSDIPNPYVELTVEDANGTKSDVNFYMLIESTDYIEELKENTSKTRSYILFFLSFVIGPIATIYYFMSRRKKD